MKVLVTGGAGYIGSHTSKALARLGHEVVVFDNLSTGHRDLVRWGAFEEGDLRDTTRIRQVLAHHRPDGVIHFAALSQVGQSVLDPALYFDNNMVGTLRLLDAMRETGIGRIVVSGSSAVYGAPEEVPIMEDAPKNPVSPYGTTKLFMERMLEAFETAYGLRWVALRYFNAAGCDPEGETGERHVPETHLIPRALMAAAGEVPGLELFGDDYPTPDGTCIRDYIHVQDLASAHVRAFDYLTQRLAGQSSQTGDAQSCALNLGSGAGFSVREILDGVARVTGKKVPFTVMPRRAGDPPCLVADASRALAVLGWKVQHSSVEDVLRTAWNWHCKDKAQRA